MTSDIAISTTTSNVLVVDHVQILPAGSEHSEPESSIDTDH